jgi:EAL and modified HD-GYP domain-containing signal transduction protein
MNLAHVVVGRQPIYNRDLIVVGYELLFRSSSFRDSAGIATPGDEMTASVFAGAISIGQRRLVGDKDIFCNADRGVLTGAVPLLLPPERTTIEVTDSTHFDAELEEGCRRLIRAGYQIALDEFLWFPGAERALQLASTVKIDVRRHGVDAALELAERVRPFDVRIVGHKLETEAALGQCLDAGFDLFQGFALARPTTISGAKLEASSLGVLQIAAATMDASVDIRELERIIRRDPALTVQLLEIASIGALGELRRPVRSIRDALVYLGVERLRSWVTLLMLRSTRNTLADELVTVLARARTCELLAGDGDAAMAFTVGMISALDRFLKIPAVDLAQLLPLDSELLDAAFAFDGPTGRLVQQVVRAESAEPADAEMRTAITQALDWAVQSAELLELSDAPVR